MHNVHIIEGSTDDGAPCAVLFDPVTNWAFGPLFADRAEAEAFVAAVPRDPRGMDDGELEEAVALFRKERGA